MNPKGAADLQQSLCDRCHCIKATQLCFFKENISYFFERNERTFVGRLCFCCMTRIFCEFSLKTLIGTWWGIIGALLGPAILGSNMMEYVKNSYKFMKRNG